MKPNARLAVRPTPEDLRTLEEISELAPQSRTDVIRSAIAVAYTFVRQPFLLVKDGKVQLLRIAVPSMSLEDDGRNPPPQVQVRKDQQIEEQIDYLRRNGRFGANTSSIVRTSINFYKDLLEKCSYGWQCCREITDGSLTPVALLEDLGVKVQARQPTQWFSTKPSRRGFRTKPT